MFGKCVFCGKRHTDDWGSTYPADVTIYYHNQCVLDVSEHPDKLNDRQLGALRDILVYKHRQHNHRAELLNEVRNELGLGELV